MLASFEVARLTRRYGDLIAVDDISFAVAHGSVFSQLGTDDAGKSTTIACLTTAARPDSGRLSAAGHDVGSDGDAVRRAIGVVFQDSILDDGLTVRENLTVRGMPYSDNRRAIRDRRAYRSSSTRSLTESTENFPVASGAGSTVYDPTCAYARPDLTPLRRTDRSSRKKNR